MFESNINLRGGVNNQHPLTTSVVPVYICATSWIDKALSLCVPTVQKARTATAATECQHQLPWFSHTYIYIYIENTSMHASMHQSDGIGGHKQIWFSGFCTPPTLHKHMRCSCTLCSCFWNSSIIAYNALLYLLLLTRIGPPSRRSLVKTALHKRCIEPAQPSRKCLLWRSAKTDMVSSLGSPTSKTTQPFLAGCTTETS